MPNNMLQPGVGTTVVANRSYTERLVWVDFQHPYTQFWYLPCPAGRPSRIVNVVLEAMLHLFIAIAIAKPPSQNPVGSPRKYSFPRSPPQSNRYVIVCGVPGQHGWKLRLIGHAWDSGSSLRRPLVGPKESVRRHA